MDDVLKDTNGLLIFTVPCLVARRLNESETGVGLVLIVCFSYRFLRINMTTALLT